MTSPQRWQKTSPRATRKPTACEAGGERCRNERSAGGRVACACDDEGRRVTGRDRDECVSQPAPRTFGTEGSSSGITHSETATASSYGSEREIHPPAPAHLAAIALLFLVLTIALAAVGEGPYSVLRSHSRSSDTWTVQMPGRPPPTPEDVRDHAARFCAIGVEGVAQQFYTPSIAVVAAHEYAEGYSEGPYMEAAFGGCLAGMTSANPSG